MTAEEYLVNPQAFAGQQLRVSGKVAGGSLEVDGRGEGRFSLAAGDGNRPSCAGVCCRTIWRRAWMLSSRGALTSRESCAATRS